jgi:hypothetical protein
MVAPRKIQQIVLACALAAGVAACSSSGNNSGSGATSAPASSASAPASASPGSGSAAAAQIATNWTTFFNAKTPVAKRVALLQDGQKFATIIKSQAGSGLAASATAKVTKVTVQSPTQAKVSYSILIGGSPALANQTGVAVKEGGTWKVGLASFCGLLTLENNGTAPSACKTTG